MRCGIFGTVSKGLFTWRSDTQVGEVTRLPI